MHIALVNSKGGVAKTTSSVFIACALAREGKVLLLDADPQGSASDWAETAIEDGNPLPFEVRPANKATLSRLGNTADYAHIVIDTPPGEAATIDAAVAAADVVIIPSEAAAMDLRRVWPTLEHLPASTPRVVLLVKAATNTLSHREAIALMDNEEVPLFSTVVPRREAIKNAFGTNPSDLGRYTDVVTELKEAMR